MASRTLLALLALLYSARASLEYQLSVQFISYENPFHKLCSGVFSCQPRCCDAADAPSSYYTAGCTDPETYMCDNYFKFCLRQYGRTNTNERIPGNLCHTGTDVTTMDYPFNDDDFDFAIGESGLGSGLPNPYVYNIQTSWLTGLLQGVQLYVEVIDRDSETDDDLVDVFIVNVDLFSSLGSYTILDPWLGHYGFGSLNVSLQLTCPENYYGPDCNRFCQAKNDSSGHFYCNDEGDIVCSDGYQDLSSNCTLCVPREGCSSIGGYCQLPGECQCSLNYYGPNCSRLCQARDDSSGHFSCNDDGDIVCSDGYQDLSSNCTLCIPQEGCSTVGGYCVLAGECWCHPYFTGNTCETDLDPCGHQMPCQNGGTCNNTGADTYQCTCLEGYTGANCETLTDTDQTGGASSSSSSSEAAIAGGVVGGLLGVVVVMTIVGVVVVFWTHSRKKKTAVIPVGSTVMGSSCDQGQAQPHSRPKSATYSHSPPPMDNPMYDCSSAVPPSAVPTGSSDLVYHKFDNPMYDSGAPAGTSDTALHHYDVPMHGNGV